MPDEGEWRTPHRDPPEPPGLESETLVTDRTRGDRRGRAPLGTDLRDFPRPPQPPHPDDQADKSSNSTRFHGVSTYRPARTMCARANPMRWPGKHAFRPEGLPELPVASRVHSPLPQSDAHVLYPGLADLRPTRPKA